MTKVSSKRLSLMVDARGSPRGNGWRLKRWCAPEQVMKQAIKDRSQYLDGSSRSVGSTSMATPSNVLLNQNTALAGEPESRREPLAWPRLIRPPCRLAVAHVPVHQAVQRHVRANISVSPRTRNGNTGHSDKSVKTGSRGLVGSLGLGTARDWARTYLEQGPLAALERNPRQHR